MSNLQMPTLFIVLAALVLISGFFSGSETGMMALNRYRLRHLVRKGHHAARRVMHLLQRPDRLLGVILIGNTFANILASSVMTLIAVRYFGNIGLLVSTVALTFTVLIFAEITPKTFAALYPQRVALLCSLPLKILLFLLYPLVWVSNGIANGFLRLFQIKVSEHKSEPLTLEELRTVVHEASSKVSSAHQQMLLRILELEKTTVDDVMVPRNEIVGIDITAEWENIFLELMHTSYEFLPVYREDIDEVLGMLSVRRIVPLLRTDELTKDKLLSLLSEVYYIPEMTFLSHQLLNFQQENRAIGLVIDEYGDIQGLVKMQDILEEIVGQFAVDIADTESLVRKQKDGSYLVDAAINVRDLNRITQWNLPTQGPRTLSGLIVETLEMIPANNIALRLAGYPMEVLKVSGNKIRLVQVWPNRHSMLL